MTEKKEGAKMTCQNCNTELICRMKDYGGGFAPKLQWQNDDGTAHYNTTNGKDFTCNIPKDDKPQEVASIFTEDQTKTIEKEIDVISAIELLVTKKLKTNTIDPNPAKIGMYVKFIYDKVGHFQK